MNHFFLNHEMFVCGSTYGNMCYGQLPGDVLKDEEGWPICAARVITWHFC